MTDPIPSAPNPGLAARISAILQAAMAGLAMRVRPMTSLGRGVALMPEALSDLVGRWLHRRGALIREMIARIEAGTQRRPLPHQTRGRYGPRPAPARPAIRMPGIFGWGGILSQQTGWQHGALTAVLADPALKQMALEHPRLGTLLLPVMRMLGVTRPDWMAKPARRPTSRPRRAAPIPATEQRPAPPPDPSYDLTCLVMQTRAQWLDDQAWALKIRRAGEIEPPRIPIPLPDPRGIRPKPPPPPELPPPRPRALAASGDTPDIHTLLRVLRA